MESLLKSEVEGRLNDLTCVTVSVIQSDTSRAATLSAFRLPLVALLQAYYGVDGTTRRQRTRILLREHTSTHLTLNPPSPAESPVTPPTPPLTDSLPFSLRFLDDCDTLTLSDLPAISLALSHAAPKPGQPQMAQEGMLSHTPAAAATDAASVLLPTDTHMRAAAATNTPYNVVGHSSALSCPVKSTPSYPQHILFYNDLLFSACYPSPKPLVTLCVLHPTDSVECVATQAGDPASRYYVVLDVGDTPDPVATDAVNHLKGLYPPEACHLLHLPQSHDVHEPPHMWALAQPNRMALSWFLNSLFNHEDTRASAAYCFPQLSQESTIPTLTVQARDNMVGFLKRVLVGLVAPTLERRMRALEQQVKQQKRGLRTQFRNYLGMWQRPKEIDDASDASSVTSGSQGPNGEVPKALGDTLFWTRAYDKATQSYRTAHSDFKHARQVDEGTLALIGSGMSQICSACQGADLEEAKEGLSDYCQAMTNSNFKPLNAALRLLYVGTAVGFMLLQLHMTPLTIHTLNDCIRIARACVDQYHELVELVSEEGFMQCETMPRTSVFFQKSLHLQRAFLLHSVCSLYRLICAMLLCKGELVNMALSRASETPADVSAQPITTKKIQTELLTFAFRCFPHADPNCSRTAPPSVRRLMSRVSCKSATPFYFDGLHWIQQSLFEAGRQYHLGGNSEWAGDCCRAVLIQTLSFGTIPNTPRGYFQWGHMSLQALTCSGLLSEPLLNMLIAFILSQHPSLTHLSPPSLEFDTPLELPLMIPFLLCPRSVRRHCVKQSWFSSFKSRLRPCGVSLTSTSPTYRKLTNLPLHFPSVESLINKYCRVKNMVQTLEAELVGEDSNCVLPRSDVAVTVILYNPFRDQTLTCSDFICHWIKEDVSQSACTDPISCVIEPLQMKPVKAVFSVPSSGSWTLYKATATVCGGLQCTHHFTMPQPSPPFFNLMSTLDGFELTPAQPTEPLVLECPEQEPLQIQVFVRDERVDVLDKVCELYQYELSECRIRITGVIQRDFLKIIVATNNKILVRDETRKFERRLCRKGTTDVTVDIYGSLSGAGGLRVVVVNDDPEDYHNVCVDLQINLVEAVSLTLIRINESLYHASLINKSSTLVLQQYAKSDDQETWVQCGDKSVVLYPEETWKAMYSTHPNQAVPIKTTEMLDLNEFVRCIKPLFETRFLWIAAVADKNTKLILMA